jgi:hypothetical protein
MNKICGVCGKEFNAPHSRNRFCSRECGVIGRSGPSRKTSVAPNIHCFHCGNRIYRKAYLIKNNARHFCSRECKGQYDKHSNLGKNNPNYKAAGMKACVGCGRTFQSYNKGRRYCGIACSQKYSRSDAMLYVRRGREAEKWCAKELKKAGFTTFLSTGSRGPFDVIAINPIEILLIQVKRTKHKRLHALPNHLRQLSMAVCPDSEPIKRQVWTYSEVNGWIIDELKP